MILCTSLLLCIALSFQLCGAFQVLPSPQFKSRRDRSDFRRTTRFATPSTVSVCTADLCCCQEEGLGGDQIFADLQARDLPYPIDEAPCLGACGGGAMVAIDFDDGSFALVAGIEETLAELGISESTPATTSSVETEPALLVEINESKFSALETPLVAPLANTPRENVVTPTGDEVVAPATEKGIAPITSVEDIKESAAPVRSARYSPPSQNLVDVRERMRAEASKYDDEPANPWLNTASYLAGKAAEKLFGK
jgi:hypothetical protein